jgi:pyruvate/2-oxoglutarate dehydrogenase complex dihydrolipoamide acyltransferase (E2) component
MQGNHDPTAPPPHNPKSVPIILPDLGVASARLSVWFAEPGDLVYEGERLVEVAVGGATFDVSAPATGRLAERFTIAPDEVKAGQVLGEIIGET